MSAETSESPQEVSFLIDDGTGWRRVAVDDLYPYRAFVDPDALPTGSTSRIVAVSRFADGTLVSSGIAKFTNTK